MRDWRRMLDELQSRQNGFLRIVGMSDGFGTGLVSFFDDRLQQIRREVLVYLEPVNRFIFAISKPSGRRWLERLNSIVNFPIGPHRVP